MPGHTPEEGCWPEPWEVRMKGPAGDKRYKAAGALCLPCKWVQENPARLRRDWPSWAEWLHFLNTGENSNKKRKWIRE